MKRIFCIGILLNSFAAYTQKQLDIRNIDNIYYIGNGRMAVYEAKADILQLFSPPYSSPSLLQMILNDSTIKVRSKREKGTAIWTENVTE